MTALIIGIAVGVYNNRGGSTTNGTHPAVLPPGESNGSTRGKLLFTHFRAELRGPAPKGIVAKPSTLLLTDSLMRHAAKERSQRLGRGPSARFSEKVADG